MKNLTLLISILLFFPALSFSQKERTIDTKVTKVTVFMTGALVTREGKTDLDEGRNVLLFKGLSHLLDKSTINLNAGKDVTVMSIKHQIEYLGEKKDSPRIKRLKDSIAYLNDKIEEIIVQYQILRQKEAYLVYNRKMETGSEHFNPQKFKELNDYYSDQFLVITNKKYALNDRYKKLTSQKFKYFNELRALENPKSEETSTVEVLVTTNKKTSVNLVMQYSVTGAGWTPSYDIKVNQLDKPLEIVYKANVAQNTGEDWTNVELLFSNGNPERNNTVPVLGRYYLNYIDPYAYLHPSNQVYDLAKENMSMIREKTITGLVLDSETGLPLPFASINDATGQVTVTDENGEFKVDVPESLSNLTVSYLGYASVSHNLLNGTNVIYLNSNAVSAFKEVAKREDLLKQPEEFQTFEWSFADSVDADDSDGWASYYNVETRSSSALGLYEVSRKKGRGAYMRSLTGYKGESLARPIENNITLEFSMKEKYTIRSNGKPEVLEMTTLDVPALYEYYTIPKIEQSAFLIAHVVDWAQYQLLPGETNLYLGESYVGKSELNVYYISDTLNISLGRDPSVTVKREKVKEFSGRQLLGSDNVDKRQFRIRIMNNKSTDIQVVVLDQIPVSNNKQITVELGGISGSGYNEETGEVRKVLKIKPGSIAEMDIKYTVKYPKGQTLNLE